MSCYKLCSSGLDSTSKQLHLVQTTDVTIFINSPSSLQFQLPALSHPLEGIKDQQIVSVLCTWPQQQTREKKFYGLAKSFRLSLSINVYLYVCSHFVMRKSDLIPLMDYDYWSLQSKMRMEIVSRFFWMLLKNLNPILWDWILGVKKYLLGLIFVCLWSMI